LSLSACQEGDDVRASPRVIRSSDTEAEEGELERRFDGPPPRARPSDRLEPWRTGPEAHAALARAAARERVDADLAAILVVERALLEADLRERGLDFLTTALDARARSTTVEVALSEGQRAYLRVLCEPRVRAAATAGGLLAIPMRLTERIDAETLDEHVQPELLSSALLWERAAVACGRTMSEWAALAALDLLATTR